MPKRKTVKGVKRRFKVTATGKILAFPSGKRHLLGSRSAKQKRKLRRARVVSRSNEQRILPLLA